jgi:glutathione S-transferase
MYRLYGTRQTGSCATHAALAEAGAAFELIEVSTCQHQHLTEDYRRINPRQQVPALGLPDGSVMTEGAAILMHIADAHPNAHLAPPPGSAARAQLDRWLVFFAVNVYEGELRKLFGDRYTDDPDGAPAVQRAAADYVERQYQIFETALGPGPYAFKEQFTVLDIYVWMLAQWIDGAWLRENCPKIGALAGQVKKRPKIEPIHRKNFE